MPRIPVPPDTGVLPAVRRRMVADLLLDREYITVEEVRDATGASLSTARRDLEVLSAQGVLVRIRGGATRPHPQPRPPLQPPVRPPDVHRLLTRARNRLSVGDVDATEDALREALRACRLLRTP